MSSRIAIFSKYVRDFMGQVPLAVAPSAPLDQVVGRMAAEDASSATVVNEAGQPIGIVTEQDITRQAAFQARPDQRAETIMTSPVLTIPADEYLYHAIGRMRRRSLRHMPVVDGAGGLVGMLDLHDTMAVASEGLIGQIDRLTTKGTRDELKAVKQTQVELARELFDEGHPATAIQALLTHINNDIYKRIVDGAVQAMEKDGLGPPPVAFDVIVFGSGGRDENYLFPDQDNGFVLADYPDAEHNRIDGYFIELAERMTKDLDYVGFPLCKGYCMATNPLWRKTISQWIEQINLWSQKHNFVALRLSDIFFDFRAVWGEAVLAGQLRREVTQIAKGNKFFLSAMFHEIDEHDVALGFFGRFITEKEKKEYRGQINLKHTGTLPLVETVRLLALREGATQTHTLKRIDALYEKDVLDRNELESLTKAFTHLTDLALRRQVSDFLAGNPVSYYVDPKRLTKSARTDLTRAFTDINVFLKRVRSDFTGEVF